MKEFLGQVRTLDGLKSSTTLSWKPSSSCPCQVLQACNTFKFLSSQVLAEMVGSFVTSEFIINLDARFMFV